VRVKRLLLLLLLIGCGSEPAPHVAARPTPAPTPVVGPAAPAEPAFDPFELGWEQGDHPVLLVADDHRAWSEPLAELLRVAGIVGVRRATPAEVLAERPDASIILLPPGSPDSLAPTVQGWLADRKDVLAIQPTGDLLPLFGLRNKGVTDSRWLRDDQQRLLRLSVDSMRYGIVGARPLAWLQPTPDGPPQSPAITSKKHEAGGHAIAFAFPPARAVAYARQGNPAWIAQDRDGDGATTTADLFFGGDDPDWVEWGGLERPVADAILELLIDQVTADSVPIPVPRFALLPHGATAALMILVDGAVPDVTSLGAEGCADTLLGCPRLSAAAPTDGAGPWSQWTAPPKAAPATLDLSYGPGAASWNAGRPGFVSGTARPARFADLNGETVPTHQLPVALATASGHAFPADALPLLDAAAAGAVEGVITIRLAAGDPGLRALVTAALERELPFVTREELAAWLPLRESARIEALALDAGKLTFTIPEHGAAGLHLLMPRQSGVLRASAVDRGDAWVPSTPVARDGRPMMVFAAEPGPYVVQFVPGRASAGGAAPTVAVECLSDVAVADFALGVADGTEVVSDGDGSVVLAAAAGSGFDDGRIPPSLRPVVLGAGGAARVVEGQAVLDGAELVGPEWSRRISARARVSFSEDGQGLVLRVPGSSEAVAGLSHEDGALVAFVGDVRESLPADLRSAVEVSIERTPDSIEFAVGDARASLPAHSGPLELVARDATRSDRVLKVDSLRLLPLRAEGTFTSRVLPRPSALEWTHDAPPGTSVRIEIRAGHRAEPPVAWSDWLPMEAAGFVQPHGAFVQYRATLTADGDVSPRLTAMHARCGELQDTSPDWDQMDPIKKAAAQSQR